MNVLSTLRCHAHSHPEFAIEFDPQRLLGLDAQWMADLLESWVADGQRFSDGESVQIGWSFTRLRQGDDGLLHFEEPDFESMPIVWTSGLTATLLHLRLHKDTAMSVIDADAMDTPSLRQSCLICTRLKAGNDFMMMRTQPDEWDSGWFIGCLEDDHDHNEPDGLVPESLYQAIVEHAPLALAYLGLPAGTAVRVESGQFELFDESGVLKPAPGSYLDAVRRKGTLPRVKMDTSGL